MIVKVCGITNLEDAVAAVENGANALGFNFYAKSPRYIRPSMAASIIKALPSEVWKVGVFVNEPADSITCTAAALGLDVVQLHGDEPPECLPDFPRIWKALHVGPDFHPAVMDTYDVEAFLLDAPAGDQYGGTGNCLEWSLVTSVSNTKKIILAGGLDENNVEAAIRTLRPWGVDACSRLEVAPGKKDHFKMARFLKAALLGYGR
jgi:phosphoribosylanthranilate isomerase